MMGGLVIETVRPGVQFVPDAANAFRRANAQVRKEFGRDIDVNSTYRSWSTQLAMYKAWQRYVAGIGPYPGHSKAVHPSESFHVAGTALDSDDWTNARIVAILAESGFIRNRLHVPGEQHHFEHIPDRDQHRGEPAGGGSTTRPSKEDTMPNNIPPLVAQANSSNIWALDDRSKKYLLTPVQMDVYRALAEKRGLDINDFIAEGVKVSDIPNA